MSSRIPRSSTDPMMELTSPENVPETGMQVEVETERDPDEVRQEECLEVLYCICRRPWTKEFMIMCEHCQDWFHGNCVGITEFESLDIDRYHCVACERRFGKSILKSPSQRQVTAGSEQFIVQLKKRTFADPADIVRQELGELLSMDYLSIFGFTIPILIDKLTGLGMKLPPSSITVHDVERFVGPAMQVEVIKVETQSTVPMTLRQFIQYFTAPNRKERLNLISLEVSGTALGQLIEPPQIVRRLDWVENLWPKAGLDKELYERPKVAKYCLIGSKDSYTDFHIDFGGTSVWYHVLWGEKVFYLIEPTDINLALYEKWMSSSPKDKFEAFFGDTVDYCYKLVLKAGQTLLIPTGWIHAVYTSMDSLVFGGNFLHIFNMDLQLRIYNMEKKLNIKRNYMFPSFELIHWLAALFLAGELEKCSSEGRYPAALRLGVKTLLQNLSEWSQNDRNNGTELIPAGLNTTNIIKKLTHQLNIANKLIETKPKLLLPDFGLDVHGMTPTAEMFSFKCMISNDSEKEVFPTSSSSQDESSVLSPSDPEQPPIRLKLKKHRQTRTRHESWSTEESKPSPDSSQVHDVGSPGIESKKLKEPSQKIAPTKDLSKNGPLKIRVSLSEARTQFVGNHPMCSNEKSESEGSDDDSHLSGAPDDKKKSSSRHHHHKSKHRSRRHRKNRDGQELLFGGKIFVNSTVGHRVQPNDESDEQFRLGIVTEKNDSRGESAGDMRMSNGERNQEKFKKRKHKKTKHRHRDRSGEEMKKVHQDDEYVYPSLTVSDDEDSARSKKRGRFAQDVDEAWSPGNSRRVSKSIVKSLKRPPSRPGAQRKAVAQGLSDAANTLASQDALKKVKRKYTRRPPLLVSSTNGATAGPSNSVAGPSTSKPPVLSDGPSTSVEGGGAVVRKRKLPKGMATAKQRLSKILKLKGKF